MMEQTKSKKSNFLLRIIQGALIGLGAVLPGISGGVLCVIFGIYKTIMEFLADPFRKMKTHLPLLIPVGIGGVIGFLGIANVLSFFLEKYPAPSVCLFVGLIGGMLPSLFREAGEQGRSKASYVSMYEGEVKNGKPHGCGSRNFYYEGKWSALDECVWIDGIMIGYDYARELEFSAFEDQKIGFVINDRFVGNIRIIASDGEEFDDGGTKFTV